MNEMLNMKQIGDEMPPLRKERDPGTAAIIGFFFGGIGLGIYFGSFIDFIIPLLIAIGLWTTLSQVGLIGGVVIATAWGYFRAVSSNEKLAQTRRQ